MRAMVSCGRSETLLQAMPDRCVDALVSDPPYGIGFMGREWDRALPPTDVWFESFRVMKPGAYGVIFGFPKLAHRLAVQLEDAGFEIVDTLAWIFGSGFPKSLDISRVIDERLGNERSTTYEPNGKNTTHGDGFGGGSGTRSPAVSEEAKRWEGWGTALKPAYEPILLVQRPSTLSVAETVLANGVGGINVDACRVESAPGDEPRRWAHGRGMGFGGAQDRGSCAALTSPGRWPANVILDTEAGAMLDRISSGASRFFYCPKASRFEREDGLAGLIEPAVVDPSQGEKGRASPRAGTGRRGDARLNDHPTVKPIALMRWLVRLIAPPGALVLDPFCGSGTTGIACALEGHVADFVGFDRDARSVQIARARIAHWKKGL